MIILLYYDRLKKDTMNVHVPFANNVALGEATRFRSANVGLDGLARFTSHLYFSMLPR